MKHGLFSSVLLSTVLLLFSCEKETGIEPKENRKPIEIKATFQTMTRVSTVEEAGLLKCEFDEGDSIGIFAVINGTDSLYINNQKLVFDYATKTWKIEVPAEEEEKNLYYPSHGEALDFYAYYPYDSAYESLPNPLDSHLAPPVALHFAVQEDQSTISEEDFQKSDFLFSTAENQTQNMVLLPFAHKMALLELRVEEGSTPIETNNFTVTVTNVYNESDITISNGSVALSGATKTITMLYKDTELGMLPPPNTHIYWALVPPQTIADNVALFSFVQSGSLDPLEDFASVYTTPVNGGNPSDPFPLDISSGNHYIIKVALP
ncbi:fimbrillin family protein [Parabacteroides sp. PF5-9]|uniref:fimbrillin family protein n=1 Tax=Parabacteroides sp. PF5-9 TaxID=1742404 RepID=UPI00247559FD|nr:fimbrillin family protein [Parabacteroides sp. PF5-9]MDH6359217.1 hypothetical protein [Parabacteroides sp. PF5-9]